MGVYLYSSHWSKFFTTLSYSFANNLVHVIVFILTQATTEDNLRLGISQLFVLGVECAVLGIVDGIVWLVAGLPLAAVLAADDGLGQVVAVLVLAELEPLVLDDACPRCFPVGVVDSGVALKTGLVQQFVLEADRTVFQRTQLVVKVGINGSCVDNFVRQIVQFRLVFQVICVQPDLNAVQQVGNHLGVAADGNALVQGVEIVVVKCQAHRQTLDDESGQLFAVSPPLLLGVTLDKFFINVTTDEGDSLFFQIPRFMGDFLTLLLDFGSSLLWRYYTPHFVKGVHVERQRVEFTLVVGDRRVCKTVELSELGDVIPDFFVVCMENMGTVLVDVDTFDIFGVNVTCNIGAFIHN